MNESVSEGCLPRAPFMTPAMWFVWLLRADIRADAALSDVKAQREFISWWLLWAHAEYPAVFSWSLEHAEIGMELVKLESGLLCPQLLVRLYAARHDLRRAFSLDDLEGIADYFCWYRLHAPTELAIAPSLPKSCLVVTEEPSERCPWCANGTRVPRIAIALSKITPNLLRGSIDTIRTRHALAAWYTAAGHTLIPSPTPPLPPRPIISRETPLQKNGVNVIGFVNAQSGLGEDVRMMAAGLTVAGYPHVLLDASGDDQLSQSAESGPNLITNEPQFATSIYCMSAFDMATLYLRRGPNFFSEQYRVGYWPWELPKFPDVWTDVYNLVDEIWTGSEFTANAYRVNCTKPVRCLPAPVTVPVVKRRTLAMINKGSFVFTYTFDPNSYMARKNPIAFVRAFHLAVRPDDNDVALLLRVNGTLLEDAQRSELLREIGMDERIVVMEGTLDRAEALGITASCDCFVSPHRAEGFGRNIAEAILLHVPVLATAFSGCEDFLEPGEGLAFDLHRVVAGQYPFCDGLFWAEPIVADMAEKMKSMRTVMRRHRLALRKRLAERAVKLSGTHGPGAAGRAISQRLHAIQMHLPASEREHLSVAASHNATAAFVSGRG